MSNQKTKAPREYKQKLRAEKQDQTRERITVAAMELHGTVGPANTTISAVAERAGVQRATVYRHFKDDAALFEACSSHWMQLHPPPDPNTWALERDPVFRIEQALDELYAYYAETEEMLANLIRDESLHPAIPPLLAAFWGYLDAATDLLASGRGWRGRRQARGSAAIRLAVDFRTWQLLVRQRGLSITDAAALMSESVNGSIA